MDPIFRAEWLWPSFPLSLIPHERKTSMPTRTGLVPLDPTPDPPPLSAPSIVIVVWPNPDMRAALELEFRRKQ